MDFNAAMLELGAMPGKIESVLTAAMRRIVRYVAEESRKNAPKSPTQKELDKYRTEIYGDAHTKRIKKLRSLHAKGSSAAQVNAEKTAARKLKRKQKAEKNYWNKLIKRAKARKKRAEKVATRRSKKAERKIMARLNRQERTAARRERKREAKAIRAERRRERRSGRRRTRRRRK